MAYLAAGLHKERRLSGIRSRTQTGLDRLATFAWALSIGLLVMVCVDLWIAPAYTVGSHPGFPFNHIRAMGFIAVMSMPTLCCVVVWPVHMRQKKQGKRVFSLLPFVVMASALWMWIVFWAVTGQ